MTKPMPFHFEMQPSVRLHLLEKGVPYRVLAEQLGVTRPYVTQLINRRKHLSAEVRWQMKLAPVLEGLTDDELWRRVDGPPPGRRSR